MKKFFNYQSGRIFLILSILTFFAFSTSSLGQSQDKPKKKAKLPPENLRGSRFANAKFNFTVSTLKVNKGKNNQRISQTNEATSTQALAGISISNPTSLQFGPDNRLYVTQQNGLLKALNIVRNGPDNYVVTATETISLINGIPNYNDDGTAATVTTRQITGILVVGTATTPVLYVSSSDSRIGGPTGDKNLDTNSGVISKLTKTSTGWDKIDLVRGLPRSEENHSNNGMQLDSKTNTLYVASGGFTNAGSPSNNFAFICEYALSAAILAIDLNAINALPTIGTGNNKYKYNLPTVDDPTRANTSSGADPGDPFGGNDGLNQAKIVAGGPVQIYSPGYRNAYDLIITKNRQMYTIDNGANQGWGGHPANEGSTGTVTNNYVSGEPGSTGSGPNDPKVNNLDNLHHIGNIDTYVKGSHYGGHPTPIRANPSGAGLYTYSTSGVWRTSKTGTNPLPADWPPLPASEANPIEGNFQNPGETDRALLTFAASTNGIVEYTATGFSSLQGHLLAAGYKGDIYKITLNGTGTDVLNTKGAQKINQDLPFASGFGSQPLDITAQGDDQIFPGTVWAATYGADAITIFEPASSVNCTGQYDSNDDDADGFTNADEIDNATNPCSNASRPIDSNGNKISDLNDPDDDSDGIGDGQDYFALDANNGLNTTIPLKYDLFNNDPGTGLFGLGFTGLMSNEKVDNDYYEQFQEDNLIAGGAVGAFSVVDVTTGDALGTLNNQQNGFQFGINVNSGTSPFTIQARMLSAFFNNQAPTDYQSQGLYIGTGDQSNYLKIVLNANGGIPNVQVVVENADIATTYQYSLGGLPAQTLDLFLSINPATGTVQPKYSKDGANPVMAGSPITVSGKLLTAIQSTPALAVGILSTSRGTTPFTATWDFIDITLNSQAVTSTGKWHSVVPASGAPTARHEAAYVQAGNKFYLLGGRGIKPVQIYNPATKTWTNGANPPKELHHFQAVALDGLIYVAGAHTGGYPNETAVPNIYIYDPVKNTWTLGPTIPTARRRGSAGVVIYNNKIYMVGGIINGHNSGHVKWMDEYDPATNTWAILPDAPRARDHFHAVVVGGKVYAAGGRRTSTSTGQTFTLTIPEVDVFDFATNTWSTLTSNIPTQRAAAAVGVLGDELIVMGGESGAITTAHNETEALNIKTNTWRSLSKMIQGRHGTQAIVNNNGIYVATGSGGRGGSPELSTQEAFYFSSPTTPTGASLSASSLTNTPLSVAMGQVAVASSKTAVVTISNSGSNQGIIITKISLGTSTEFNWSNPLSLPIVIGPGKSFDINVTFTPASTGSKFTSLEVQHSGSNAAISVPVSGEGGGTSTPQATYLINAGASSSITTGGKTWSADKYYIGGKFWSNANIADITNTTDDVLYKSERSSSTGQFAYAFPVSSGSYTVILHFAEIYWGATGGGSGGTGKRVFSVNFEGGTSELTNFDIYAQAGAMKAITKTFTTSVSDGTLNIDFLATVDQPKVSAIEVRPYTSTGPTLTATPSSLHFFSQQAGTTSASQAVSLKNTGTTSINVSGVSITGANSSEFAHSFTTATTIAAGASTSVGVTFKPASLGTKVAQLNITHSGANSPLAVGLTGEGHDNPPSGQSVVSFTLINADTEQPIKTLVEGEEINLATLSTKNLNIRANTNPYPVGSVVFNLTGAMTKNQTETSVPYALYGDSQGNYNAWIPVVGSYSLTGTPYSSTGGTGTKGTPRSLNFVVSNTTSSVAKSTPTNFQTNNRKAFRIYPNPSGRGKISIEAEELEAGEKLTLNIYDVSGSLVATKSFKADNKGRLAGDMELTRIVSQGMYTVILQNKNHSLYHKLTIIE